MRKTTLLWLILAAFCGTALFHTSQKVHDEREKLAALDVSIGKEQESLRVLNAEWSYLNQPARLEKLAKAYLQLAPLKGSQFTKVEDIPLRDAVVAMAVPTPPIPAMPPKGGIRSAAKPQFIKAHATHARPDPALRRGGEDIENTTSNDDSLKPNASARTATNTRSFTDLMKNLRTGAE